MGIFYFLWLNGPGPVYDLSRILAANPLQPQYGPMHAFHWWGQPLLGYYRSDDRAVIRQHAQMLADAGIDVVFFDVTNALTYDQNYLAICAVYQQIRAAGGAVPRIAFLANSHSAKTVQHIYDAFYAKGLHSELWFRWRGKPLLLSPPEGLSEEVKAFFSIRHSWAWSKPQGWFGDGKDKWPWLDHCPQQPGWHERPDKPEQISVCAAQHPTSNIGRSFHDGKQPPADKLATERGLCFAEQWRRALAVDPEFVFVTGWNEWVAQRFLNPGPIRMLGRPLAKGDSYFVDQYSQEFSRDIEPMQGGHGDNYYYQLAAAVRRYKGVRPLPAVTPQPIRIDGQFDDWKAAAPEFRDDQDDPVSRDHPGWNPAERYVNHSGRNDLVAAKVSCDAVNAYFYVRTKQRLSPATDPNWMFLYIDADHNPRTGWLGCDFMVRHAGAGVARLGRNVGGTQRWEAPLDIACRAGDNELELAVPRAALGLAKLPATLDFKWADNIAQSGSADDFTLHGDTAPNGRFNYRAKLETAAPSHLSSSRRGPAPYETP